MKSSDIKLSDIEDDWSCRWALKRSQQSSLFNVVIQTARREDEPFEDVDERQN